MTTGISISCSYQNIYFSESMGLLSGNSAYVYCIEFSDIIGWNFTIQQKLSKVNGRIKQCIEDLGIFSIFSGFSFNKIALIALIFLNKYIK